MGHHSGTSLKWTPQGAKSLSVMARCHKLRDFWYICGRRGMRNQAVEHNVVAFSELSFAVRWQVCYPEFSTASDNANL